MRRRFRRRLRLLLEAMIEKEVIGQEECPMMLRWEFLNLGFVKAMIHYFPPEVSDRDPHDHPRSFLTFVLRGFYLDTSWQPPFPAASIESVSTGQTRFRHARHLHVVETDQVGCWTLVIMGPIQREWGFVRLASGEWWPWGKYIQRFGGVIRCDTEGEHVCDPDDPCEPNGHLCKNYPLSGSQ